MPVKAPKVKWNGEMVKNLLGRSMEEKMGIVCLNVERDAKQSLGSGGTPKVRTGALRASITSNWTGRSGAGNTGKAKSSPVGNPGGQFPVVKGVVGSNLAYARIQELGGMIRPKRSRYLTIPLKAAKTRGHVSRGGARDFKDTFVQKSRRGNLIIFRSEGGGRLTPLFVLKKYAMIPAKPYLRPALERAKPVIVRVFSQL